MGPWGGPGKSGEEMVVAAATLPLASGRSGRGMCCRQAFHQGPAVHCPTLLCCALSAKLSSTS